MDTPQPGGRSSIQSKYDGLPPYKESDLATAGKEWRRKLIESVGEAPDYIPNPLYEESDNIPMTLHPDAFTKSPPKVLAFLQNQWLKNAELHQRRQDAMKQEDPELWWKVRARSIPFALFRGCLSGRVLTRALTESICERIIWEEASTVIGTHASDCPPANPAHMQDAVRHYEPDVVVTFGTIARNGWRELERTGDDGSPIVIHSPHPAARSPLDQAALQEACKRVIALLNA